MDGCGMPHEAKGLCDPHYKRLIRHGDPLAGRKFVGTKVFCSIHGCGGEVVGRGWCEKHYSGWRRNGDPLAVKPIQPWTEADDKFLKENHGTISLEEIAKQLGRPKASLRGRVTRIGISKKKLWSQEEEAALVALYEKAKGGGVLRLNEFAKSINRDPGNVSRKAGLMGLETNPSRRTVDQRKEKARVYATNEEWRASISERTKRRFKENGHPRGMLGKHHSTEARQRLSGTGKAYWASLTEAERIAHTDKAVATVKANGGRTVAQLPRGTWKAGWREIGGKRNFYRSRWEANYARYLEWLKSLGEITEWQHEPETFWFEAIRRGVRSYKPDFRVWEKGGSALHEVKGWMDDRSRTCLKRMAKYYPNEKLVLIDGRQYRAIRLKVMGMIEGWEDAKRDAHA